MLPFIAEEPYYGSGSGAGSGVDDEDDDEGSGLGSPFTPSHKPDHTERPKVDGNRVDDEDDDEDVIEQRTDVGHGGGVVAGADDGIQTQTSKPQSPHDTNELDEEDGDNHHDDDEDLKSSGSKRPDKMSLRRALFAYLMPLYMAWFGGIVVDFL